MNPIAERLFVSLVLGLGLVFALLGLLPVGPSARLQMARAASGAVYCFVATKVYLPIILHNY